MLEHGDARIEPVTIGVQRLDGGGEAAGLVLALLGQHLEPVGLARQIGRRNLVTAPAELGLIGHHGHHDGADGNHAPRAQPPHRAAVDRAFLGQKSGEQPAGLLGPEGVRQWVGILCHER